MHPIWLRNGPLSISGRDEIDFFQWIRVPDSHMTKTMKGGFRDIKKPCRGRVDLGGRPLRSPIEPDVPVKGIRLVTLWACPSHDPSPRGDTLGGSMPSACFRR